MTTKVFRWAIFKANDVDPVPSRFPFDQSKNRIKGLSSLLSSITNDSHWFGTNVVLNNQSDKRADCSAISWTVYRQDDHGNRFVVESGLSREHAEQLVATYERRGHKQHYWADQSRDRSG